MKTQLAQLAAGLIAIATPWIVVQLAFAMASRHALTQGVAVPPIRSMLPLGLATIASALVVGGVALWLPAPSVWIAVPSLVAFACLSALALRVLRDLDLATRAARYIDASTRSASLVSRRYSDFLPLSLRVVLFGTATAGLALFAWRATLPSPIDRPLSVPIAYAVIAPVFLWLYEAWIRALVTGPTAPGAGDSNRIRRRAIRLVFAIEALLVTGFLALAHGLLDVDWTTSRGWAMLMWVTGALLGVTGCALALSSDLITRRYRAVP